MLKRIIITLLLVMAMSLGLTGCTNTGETEGKVKTESRKDDDKKSEEDDDEDDKKKKSEDDDDDKKSGDDRKSDDDDKKTGDDAKDDDKKSGDDKNITSGKKDSGKSTSKSTDDTIISKAISEDGLITYDREDISKIVKNAGMVEKQLSYDEVLDGKTESGNQKIYNFAMQNVKSVQEMEGDDGKKLYLTTLYINGETFFVSFGTNEEHGYDEIFPYCAEGKQVEYWAYASGDEDMVILIPFIAGTEESGYYLVLPCIDQMGGDVSDFEVPNEPIGDDFDGVTVPEPTKQSTKQNPASNTSGYSFENIIFDVTGVKNDSIITTVNCTVTNELNVNIAMSGKQFILNGVDYSDSFSSYIQVDKNSTVDDEFFLDKLQLKRGDTLYIVYTVYDDDNFENLGEVFFEMTLQ